MKEDNVVQKLIFFGLADSIRFLIRLEHDQDLLALLPDTNALGKEDGPFCIPILQLHYSYVALCK